MEVCKKKILPYLLLTPHTAPPPPPYFGIWKKIAVFIIFFLLLKLKLNILVLVYM